MSFNTSITNFYGDILSRFFLGVIILDLDRDGKIVKCFHIYF